MQPSFKSNYQQLKTLYMFGRVLRPRWIRVNGPCCENWSCQVSGPMPTANALQWEGEMESIKGPRDGKYYYRYSSATNKTIAFVKITKESNARALLDGSSRRIEGTEIPGFDYEQFYRRVSENLPEWAGYRVVLTGLTKYGYMLTKGKKEDLAPKD